MEAPEGILALSKAITALAQVSGRTGQAPQDSHGAVSPTQV
jgi:hypothetical protein